MTLRATLFVTFILFSFSQLYAQHPTKDQLNKLIIKNWEADHVIFEGEKEMVEDDEFAQYEFKAGGQGHMTDTEEKVPMSWSYNPANGILNIKFNDGVGEVSQDIEVIRLSETIMVWKINEEGDIIELHLKPAKKK